MNTEKTMKAFTLIEMLIVVGILAILTAIAVPNYKVADARAKSSRIKADLNAVATAVEAFAVDNNHYPNANRNNSGKYACSGAGGRIETFPGLTTPIAYMTNTNIEDPFTVRLEGEASAKNKSYFYAKAHEPSLSGIHYVLFSPGPSRNRLVGAWKMHAQMGKSPRSYLTSMEYDPSNGTRSNGLIMRLQ